MFFLNIQVAPTSSKQHGVNVGVNASATPFQQASGYGSHGYSTGKRLNCVETACLEGHAGPLLYTCIPITQCWFSQWVHWLLIGCGVHISFVRCSICKHKQGACVKSICYACVKTFVHGLGHIFVCWCLHELLTSKYSMVSNCISYSFFYCLYAQGKCFSSSTGIKIRKHA